MIATHHDPAAGRRPRDFQINLLVTAGALAAAGLLAFSIDLPVATWCKSHRLPGEIGRLVNLLELSGHSLGAAIILLAALSLDRSLRFAWPGRSFGRARPIQRTKRIDDFAHEHSGGGGALAFVRLVAATYLGGIVVDVIKVSVERVRPRAADLATLASPFATFGDASLTAAAPHAADLMSFPSGHSAVAAGLAAALSCRYPHGTPLFVFLAGATALQRVVTSAHYPSDVAFGAAVGLVAAAACLGPGRSRADSRRVLAGSTPA